MNQSSLRILTVANTPPDPNSGAGGTVYHTNVAMRQLGHRVDEIWAPDLGPRRIRHGNLHSLLEQPRVYRKAVMKAVQQADYDVVQMSQPQAYLAAKALKQNGFKGLVINRSHGVELRLDEVLPEWHQKLGVSESRFPRVVTRSLRRLLQRQWYEVVKNSDGVIVTCEDDRDCLLKRLNVDPTRVRVIHHGVPDAFLETPLQSFSPERARRLLYVGQSAFFKGVFLLIEIVNQVLRQNLEATMCWVTTENSHDWLKAQLHSDIVPRVKFLDWQPQSQLVKLYDSCGVFLFPSLAEGAGKASLEAMARGLCVVSSNQGGMKDYTDSGFNGMLCEVGDIEHFICNISIILSDFFQAKKMSREASLYGHKKSWMQCAKETILFYSGIT